MDINQVFGTVNAPSELSNLTSKGGASGIGFFLSTIINLMFIVGGTGCVIMIVIAAVQWIFSGGDKEAISKAKGRITWAIIGVFLLALTRILIAVLESVLNFKIVTN